MYKKDCLPGKYAAFNPKSLNVLRTWNAMISYTAAGARKELSKIIKTVSYGRERIVITNHGKDVVAVVPYEDLALLEKMENLIDVMEADKALKEYEKSGESVSLDDLRREFEKWTRDLHTE